MAKNCRECGEQLIGRTDKKFCNDHCRNIFNNRLNSDANAVVRNTNNALRRNRRILQNFKTRNQNTILRDELSRSGFDFNYHTRTTLLDDGGCFFFCYEYGYRLLSAGLVAVIKDEKMSGIR